MNFLQLVQEVHRESGSGGIAPSSLVDLRGENLRLKSWVARAYLDVQEMHIDWKFRWRQHSFDLVIDEPIYNPLPGSGLDISPNSEIAEYDRDTFRLEGELLACVNYIDVKRLQAETVSSTPYQVVIMPDDTLRFDPPPDSDYTVTFDYWRTQHTLLVNDDEPIIPVRFHNVIVGKALMYYANHENAPEVMQQGQMLYSEWMQKLEADQLPGDRYMHRKAEGNDMVIYVE